MNTDMTDDKQRLTEFKLPDDYTSCRGGSAEAREKLEELVERYERLLFYAEELVKENEKLMEDARKIVERDVDPTYP